MPRPPRPTPRLLTAGLGSALVLSCTTALAAAGAHADDGSGRGGPSGAGRTTSATTEPWPGPDWERSVLLGRSSRAAAGSEFLGADGNVYQKAPVATVGRRGTVYYGEEFDTACGDGASFRHGLEKLDALARVIARSGRRVVFTVAPNKSAVNKGDMKGLDYPHGDCDRRGIRSQAEALDSYRSPHYLSVRKQLARLARSSQVYWRVDTHWTTVGNTRLAQALAARLGPDIAAAQRYKRAKRTIVPDIAALLGTPDLQETAPARLTKARNKVRTVTGSDPYHFYYPTGLDHSWRTDRRVPSLPGRTLVIGDSFMYVALESIRPLFRKGRFLWIGQLSIDEIIEAIPRYDTVVIEVVQRFLTRSVMVDDTTLKKVRRALQR